MKDGSKLVIIGDGEFAGIAYEYFTHDSPYTVVAFAVERAFIKTANFLGLPVVAFEEVEEHYDPREHAAFVAITYTQLNRLRARLYQMSKQKGFKLANYVSSRAFVWRNVVLGDNVFVFEANVIQHFSQIGNNVILWSGNHIGHRSVIEDHCYLASHIVVSGFCTLQQYCFVGVNVTIGDHVTIGRDCFLGAGCLITKDTVAGKVYSPPAEVSRVSSLRFMKVKTDTAS